MNKTIMKPSRLAQTEPGSIPAYLAAVLACLLTSAVAVAGKPLVNKIKQIEFMVRGIDISHHQGRIRWKQLRQHDIRFVYMKATEGGTFRDPRFRRNWRNAKKHGFAYGAYHFFTFCKSGRRQALNFINTVPLDANAMPPVVDVEFRGNCKRRPSQSEFNLQLGTWLKLVKRHYGKEPVLYLTHESRARYFTKHFTRFRLWIRDYEHYPVLKPKRQWLLWQYTNRGRLKGIRGPVDINRFRGNTSQFEKFRTGKPD